jgi:Concanavalin A-like lectin/glucanases superfamily
MMSPALGCDFWFLRSRTAALAVSVCWLAACGLSSNREGLFSERSSGSGGSPNESPPVPRPLPSGNPRPATEPTGGSGVALEHPDGGRAPTDAGVDPGLPDTDAVEPPDAGTPSCLGSALSLDGTNYALIPRLVADDFTLEAWIQTTTSRTGNGAFYSRPVFDSDVVGGDGTNDFVAGVLDDRYVFGAGNPDTTLAGSTPVTSGEWVHVAVTRQAATGQVRIIINGSLDATAVLPNTSSLVDSATIALGGLVDGRHFIGLIDEVRLWSVARSVDEIAASSRSRLSGSEPGLVGYYPFEDLGPNQTADLSTSAQPATLFGAQYAASSALCPAL